VGHCKQIAVHVYLSYMFLSKSTPLASFLSDSSLVTLSKNEKLWPVAGGLVGVALS
jgi:hypothetical protein